MRKNIYYHKILMCFLLCTINFVHAQTSWPSFSWTNAQPITPVISSSGIAELSGLYWNDDLKRLYAVENKGSMRVLQFNQSTKSFSLIANIQNLDSPEGVTQVNNVSQEFFTINESTYQIFRYTHDVLFANCKLVNSWDLLKSPSPMEDTDNDGPEGIAFVPDAFLTESGFVSSVTGKTYTSVKGMGGLFFIAHQKNGYVWVFDVNPDVTDDFAFVGKYKTNRKESCDITFNQSTGLLYILHNIDDNYLEVSNLKTTVSSGNYKLALLNEYYIPNPTDGNENIEGFAISSSCSDSTQVSVWLCRDIDTDESSDLQKDCLRWFKPFAVNGSCRTKTAVEDIKTEPLFTLFPNPVKDILHIHVQLLSGVNHQMKIFDMTGRLLIHRNSVESDMEINLSGFNQGIYLLQISNGSGFYYQEKFIKR